MRSEQPSSCVQRKLTCAVLCCSITLIGLVFANCTAGAGKQKSGEKGGTDEVELSVVIKAIEAALNESAKHPVEGFPRLQNVTVDLQTTISKEAGGQVKILVFNAGAKRGTESVSSITIELKPPPEGGKGFAPSSVNFEEIKNALAREIEAAKVGFLTAAQAAETLRTDKVELELGFSVSTERSGGIDTANLLPVGISADGKLSRKTGNTIKLEYSQD